MISIVNSTLQINPTIAGDVAISLPNGWNGSIDIHGPGSVDFKKVIFSGTVNLEKSILLKVEDSSFKQFNANDILNVSLSGRTGREALSVHGSAAQMKIQTLSSDNYISISNSGGSISATNVGAPRTALIANKSIHYQSNETPETEFIDVMKSAPKKEDLEQFLNNTSVSPANGTNVAITKLYSHTRNVELSYTNGTCPASDVCTLPRD